MNLKLPSSSARARTVIVAGTFLGALVTGGWLLQRGARTGTFTAYEGAHLFENVFPSVTESDFNVLSAQGLAIDEVLTVAGVGGRNQTWTVSSPSGNSDTDGGSESNADSDASSAAS